jgi:hypothetical protein
MNLRTKALSTVLALAAASAAPAGVWGFEEDDFQASDWTSSAFTQYGDALVNVLHQPNGDPENNGYLSLEFVNDPGVEAFAVSLYGGAVYDPSVQGAVSSITLGVNTRHDFANDPDLYNTIFALEQDGVLYLNSEWDAAPGSPVSPPHAAGGEPDSEHP